MADTGDLKSPAHNGRTGSSPVAATLRILWESLVGPIGHLFPLRVAIAVENVAERLPYRIRKDAYKNVRLRSAA